MAREGLMDDTGVDFEWECMNDSDQCKDCIDKDTCPDYAEMVAEQLREEQEWLKYYISTRL